MMSGKEATMKSNFCTYCPTQTQCRYIKADGICEKAAAFEAGRRDKEKEIPNNAIIIDGTMYSFDHDITEGNRCNHCDLHGECWILFNVPLCSIFGDDTAADGCFKKKGGVE